MNIMLEDAGFTRPTRLYVYFIIQNGFIAGDSTEPPAMTRLLENCNFDVDRGYCQLFCKRLEYCLYKFLFGFFGAPGDHAYFDHGVFVRTPAGVIEVTLV